MPNQHLNRGLTKSEKADIDAKMAEYLKSLGGELDARMYWWMVPTKYGKNMVVKPDAPDLFIQMRDATDAALLEFNPTKTLSGFGEADMNPYSGKWNLHLSSERHDPEYLLSQWKQRIDKVKA